MPDTDKLKSLAHDAEEQARTLMAVALALEDGALKPAEAERAIELHHNDKSLALIQSDVYPGDEYFDRAVSELDGYA